MPGMEAMFIPLRETVELLKSNAIELDLGLVGEEEALDFLERAPLAWDNTVNKTFRVKESIQPLQNAMVDFIKRCARRVLRWAAPSLCSNDCLSESWLVFFAISRPFGPRRATAVQVASTPSSRCCFASMASS